MYLTKKNLSVKMNSDGNTFEAAVVLWLVAIERSFELSMSNACLKPKIQRLEGGVVDSKCRCK